VKRARFLYPLTLPLVFNEPGPHLLRHNCLTRHGYFGRPLSIDPNPKTPTFQKREINQFHFEAVSGKMIFNEHAVVRFGTRHPPFYLSKFLLTSEMSISMMHWKILARAYRVRLIP
jgi:hypothetical protein